MKYLFIEQEAIKILVDDRNYQSAEFGSAKEFIDFIRRKQITETAKLKFTIYKETGFIYHSYRINLQNAVIFDLTLFTGFQTRPDDQIISIIQKVLRFARKHWENLGCSPNEKYLEDDHAIVFPFPLMGGTSYRVLLNLCPDKKFQEKKGVKYIAVTGDGCHDRLSDEPLSIPFKRIREDATQVCTIDVVEKEKSNNIEALDVSKTDREVNTINPNVGYETWMHLLTKNQLTFIQKDIKGAERLEGAAGTGKTLTLILKVIYNIKKHLEAQSECNMVFFTHSEATKKQIENIFQANYPNIQNLLDRQHNKVSIEIITLQEWCTKTLGGRVLPTELLDMDAQTSKELQVMFLEETFEECKSAEFESYKNFCSSEFIDFIENTDKETILQMIQSEIAITIKGRANQDIETYRNLIRLEGSIPVKNKGDYNYIFLIYEKYQEKLSIAGSFDSDDIVLSALSQLNTPLWRRRRQVEGYDVVFIDETHLFNHNELSVFHSLCKENNHNIVFAIDKTQAVGDRGLNTPMIPEFNIKDQSKTKYQTVFRSSPNIVNCAFHILSSGITLFTTFENPLDHVNYSFTAEEEKKSKNPEYYLKENDEIIIKDAFKFAERYCSDYAITKHNVLIVATTHALLEGLRKYADKVNKPYECLRQRGDIEIIKSAESRNRFVIGLIDYVGGLEFDAVIIIGVDKDRVPPTTIGKDGYIFQSYAWHNRMYVAVSRAKYILTFIGDKSRGESPILKEAINNKIVKVIN